MVKLRRLRNQVDSCKLSVRTGFCFSNNVYPCYGALRAQCGHYSYDVTIGGSYLREYDCVNVI